MEPHQESTQNMDRLAKALLSLSGGALAISIFIFVGSGGPELLAGEILLLRAAWWLLFGSLAASAGLLFVRLLPRRARWIYWTLAIGGFLAFIIGLALLVAVSTSALGTGAEGYELGTTLRG
jgi:hypothetical protein